MSDYAGIWFRNDVRLIANPALSSASQVNGQQRDIPALLLLCPQQMKAHDWAPIKWDLLCRHLDSFVQDAAAKGVSLTIEVVDSWANAAKSVKRFAQKHELTALHYNAEYPVYEQRRDRAVTAVLEEHGVAVKRHHGSLVVPPVITTQAGNIYQKFTPFSRAWREYVKQHGIPRANALPKREAVTPATIPVVDYPRRDSSAWPVGEKAVQQALREYLTTQVADYAAERDIPSLDSTSRLSPYWELGLLSPWQAVSSMAEMSPEFPAGLNKGADTWLNELIWREFYLHLMQHVPRLSYGKAFLQHTDAMQWHQNQTLFEAWCNGETGYPIVDAGMRQLASEGWMHNRVRMIVAHFLVKDLLIDWRWGEKFFMQNLIDGNFAANNGGWQWSASTGTDAAPYFRVFNPTLQSEKVDPDGSYIRKWVKQLKDCPAKQIHAPAAWLKQQGRDDYPTPIVDHKQARERFLAAFKAL